jgi:hypothetical protein
MFESSSQCIPAEHNLSLKEAQATRRREIDDQECKTFMSALTPASVKCFDENTANFDESNRRLVMASEQMVRESGAEAVHSYTGGDAEANFSSFVSIYTDNIRLLLISTARAERCSTICSLISKHCPEGTHTVQAR